ncbi:hypothetical protein [Kitasatospora sp. NPDC048407]|uniref:hypothetical protein n=1 Tax=Kitasatospora sp. NPDC048407 TaxID=3364051 RepID=UPI003715213F
MRGRAVRGVGLAVLALAVLLAGYTNRVVDWAPDGKWAPPVKIGPSVWGLTERDLVAGSFREVGRTEQMLVFVWLLPNSRWGAGVADPSGNSLMQVDFNPRGPKAAPPAAEVKGSGTWSIWTALFTVEGEEPLDLRCGSWAAGLFYLGEADGERGPYRIYLAAADYMPPGDPQLRVQRPTGMAVEQLSGWGSAPGPNPQDCSAS